MLDVVVIGAGQSGLTAAHTATQHGLAPVVLEAGAEPVGSWPSYYDSLTLFSPARHSVMPGLAFPGDPDNYPRRDDVVAYLRKYAAGVDADIRTHTPVTAVYSHERDGFLVHTADGDTLHTAGVVAATGAFGNPHRPALPGQQDYRGQILHVADYRNATSFAGQRIVVVGAGNSAVQVGYELAETATVTLATHHDITFLPQHRDGHDVHHWYLHSGFDQLPPEWLAHYIHGPLVMDTGDYANAFHTRRLDRRPLFTTLDTHGVHWPDGTHEHVDTILLATGYHPHLPYLTPLGALDHHGLPRHTAGISTTHPGLVYLGLDFQRSFSSNTLRGVHRDAQHVIPALTAHIHDAPTAAGL